MINEDFKQMAIQTWEQGLFDNFKSNRLGASFFQDIPENNNELAVAVFRYCFEKILEWSPEDVLNYLTFDHIKKLGLKKAFTNLNFPPEYKDARCAVFYVAIICYPELKRYYNKQMLWLMEYNHALNSDNIRIRFPDDINEAKAKACFLLNHVLTSGIDSRFKDIESLYEFFASKQVVSWLRQVRLSANTAGIYFKSPLEYLHESLPNDVPREVGRNDFMLQYTEFKQLCGEIPALTIRDIELARKEDLKVNG